MVHDTMGIERTPCSTCGGCGVIDPLAADLATAGIYVIGCSDEDFRSSPTLLEPGW